MHHNNTLDDPDLADAHIYLVFEKVNPPNEDPSQDYVRYVGQTCDQVGVAARFSQHLKSGYHNNWKTSTHWVKDEVHGEWTQLETTVLEQFHIEAYSGSLENRINELTAAKFHQYADNQTLRPKIKAMLPKNWEPSA